MKAENSRKIVSVLFSGGSDSALAAALLAEHFTEIHLVTFKHYAAWNVRASKKTFNLLRQKYPRVLFKHVFLNSKEMFLKLQRTALFGNTASSYYTLFFCGACKLAMHASLIKYNLENNIGFAASGASRQMFMFPDQTREGISVLEKLYRDYGIQLLNPVFDLEQTDVLALKLGLIPEKHLKSCHKAKTARQFLYVPFKNIFDNVQGFCLWIWLVDAYIWRVRRRKTVTAAEAGKYSGDYYRRTLAPVKRFIGKGKKQETTAGGLEKIRSNRQYRMFQT